jgi:TonB family protein
MPKMSYAFILSLLVHGLIGFIVFLAIDKNQSNDVNFFDEKNLISLNFGSSGVKGTGSQSDLKSTAKNSAKSNHTIGSKNQNISPQDSSETLGSMGSVGSAGSTGSGTGTGNGTGNGTGGGVGVSFGEAIESYKDPLYPKLAIRRGIEGDLDVLIQVGSDGRVQSIQLTRSSGHDILDQAALTAIKEWIFKPRNSAYQVTKKVVFKLR